LHPTDVPVVGVVRVLGGLIALSEANKIWSDHTASSIDKLRDDAAIEEAPRWFSVKEQNRLPIKWAFIDVVDPEAASLAVVNFDIVRLKWKIG
tara:strand:- start:1297 stop:1575 length:279 start_codon:yes stop_codon:yes gene_type:complete